MPGDRLLVPVILLALDPLATNNLLQTVELLVELLDHQLVLLEGVTRFLVLGE